MHRKITKRLVDSTRRPKDPKKRVYVWDTDILGFGLVVRGSSGRKSFVLRRGPRANRKFMSLGDYGLLTVEEARDAAIAAAAEWDTGGDPKKERHRRRTMPTFATWVSEYLAAVKLRKKRPEHDVYFLRGLEARKDRPARPSDALERWSDRALDGITARDIQALMDHLGQTRGKIMANRWYASLRACLAAGVRAGILQDNPAVQVHRFPENPPRQRVLSADELAQLREAVDGLPPDDRLFLLLLIATGCRKSEALAAQWSDIDLAAGTWTIPSPKAGKLQAVPLPKEAIRALRSYRPGTSSSWLFPARRGGGHRTEVKFLWGRVKAAAELPADVTMHDLRRTYGLEVARKAGILAASKLLRHADTRITAKVYTPLQVEELRAITDGISEERGKVLPMRVSK